MADDDICCNGDCRQGRSCPRFRYRGGDAGWKGSERLANLVIALLGAVALFAYFKGWFDASQ